MNAPLPAQLEANPELDRWVAFPAPGKVTVLTGSHSRITLRWLGRSPYSPAASSLARACSRQ